MEETIKKILTDNIRNSDVSVEGGDAKFTVKIVSDIFTDKSVIDRHKVVYSLLDKYIKTGEIHALTIKASTTDESR
ncbi:MAG: BolA/IbaG family iron-sulfur metabolism protein [Gammaproteobacteria bacterium]|tara:strand:+ start:1746 stop:1973 length:228 start_codon:yes stop_codon:yes gene_type:complete